MKKIQPWKTISSKTILDHALLKVNEDIVELPNGKTTTYVRHAPSKQDSVIIIAVNDSGEILLQREYSYPPNIVMWQLPGGSIEPDETTERAACRELAEESGYSAHNTEEIGYFYVQNRKSDKKQHIVVCTSLFQHKIREDDDEFIESEWVHVDNIHAMIQQSEFNNINLLAALNVWFHWSNHRVST